jgi:3-deoxy-7-phosphoheptulonate synthase
MIFEEHIPEYKLASRTHLSEDTVVTAGSVKIGAGCPVAVMAGPCAVESAESILRIAGKVKAAGASVLRGGSYKPRTSPYSFQGIGPEGIGWLMEAGRVSGMPVISELVSENDMDLFTENVDIIQIGARNMQNFALLKAVGRTQKPVLLKRGAGATIDEWIMAAEYILAGGNPNVILCERGIRTFEYATRNTMDLAVVPIIKEKTHLPIVVDPSHATGNWKYVEAVSLAAIAAGADGLLIEVHDDPDAAVSDGTQSIKPERFAELMEKARLVAKAVGREL